MVPDPPAADPNVGGGPQSGAVGAGGAPSWTVGPEDGAGRDQGLGTGSPDPLDLRNPLDPSTAEPPRPSPRALTLAASMLLTVLLGAALTVLPAPYLVSAPGPTADVLGKQGGTALITVTGATTYPTTGQLRLTTVSAVGTPGYPALAPAVIRGWLSRTQAVQPIETEVATGQTQKQLDAANAAEMISSQENATVAALTELGYEVPATLAVAGTVTGSGAEGRLLTGDVILALDGTALPDYGSLVAALRAITGGSTATVTVQRDGTRVDVPVVTSARDGGGAQLGVYIDPKFDPPVDVKISIDGIGGPSAGTMFALGIIDRLTPQDEANGQVIAGTGTIDVTGEVGEIGGIRQKMAGARRDGARWFLAPAGNCSEVVGHVPDGLRVVRVSTLHEAREAVIAIGKGDGASLPTCTAAG
jgi:PDZ domain-containing protein